MVSNNPYFFCTCAAFCEEESHDVHISQQVKQQSPTLLFIPTKPSRGAPKSARLNLYLLHSLKLSKHGGPHRRVMNNH